MLTIIVIIGYIVCMYSGYLIGLNTQTDRITNDHKKKMKEICDRYDAARNEIYVDHMKNLDKIFNDANIRIADIIAKEEGKQIKKEQRNRFYN